MIIFTGWGILSIVYIALAEYLMHSIVPSSTASQDVATGGGLLLAAILTWVTGVYVNRTRPARKAAEYEATRAAEVHQAVESGRFAPGGIRPASLEEARAQAAVMLEQERALVARGNRHTIFFIPMQWAGLLMAAVGLVSVVKAVLGS